MKFFFENPRIIFVLIYDVHKENMFTTNLEDGCEAPSKASLYINLACLSVCVCPINIKMAEPIGPTFFVGHHVTTG